MYVIYAVLLKHLCKLTPCRIKNTLETTTSSQVGDGAVSAAVRVRSLGAIVGKNEADSGVCWRPHFALSVVRCWPIGIVDLLPAACCLPAFAIAAFGQLLRRSLYSILTAQVARSDD